MRSAESLRLVGPSDVPSLQALNQPARVSMTSAARADRGCAPMQAFRRPLAGPPLPHVLPDLSDLLLAPRSRREDLLAGAAGCCSGPVGSSALPAGERGTL